MTRVDPGPDSKVPRKGRLPVLEVLLLLAGLALAEGLPPVLLAPLLLLSGASVMLHDREHPRGLLLASFSGLLLVGTCGLDLVLRIANPAFELRRRPAHPFLAHYPPGVRVRLEVPGDLAASNPETAALPPRVIHVETGPLGYRNQTRLGGHHEDVLLLGGSEVHGPGLDQHETWAARLEADHHLRTRTLGYPGATPWQQLMLLEAHLAQIPLEPGGLVLWALPSGLAPEVPVGPSTLPAPGSSLARLWVRLQDHRASSPLARSLGRSRSVSPGPVLASVTPEGRPFLFYQPSLDHLRLPLSELRKQPFPRALPEFLGAARELCEARRVRLQVALVPSKAEVHPELLPAGQAAPPRPAPLSTLLREACEAVSVPYLDMTPGFLRAARELRGKGHGRLYRGDDRYWTPAGAAVAANQVAGWEGLGLVPISDMSAM